MNLGNLAEQLEITQQSVSKWIAKDEIPEDRIEQVLAVVGIPSRTSEYLIQQKTERLRKTVGGAAMGMLLGPVGAAVGAVAAAAADRLRAPPTPGDDEEPTRPLPLSELEPRMYRDRLMHSAPPLPPAVPPDLHPPAPTDIQRSPVRRPMQNRPTGHQPWVLQLDEALRANVERRVQINGSIRTFDYLSDRAALMIRPVPMMDPARLINTAVPLLLLMNQNSSIQCHLILVPRQVVGLPPLNDMIDDPMRQRIYANRRDMVKLDLLALGITITELETAADVAHFIEVVEAGILSNPPFSYEDDDTD